MKCVIISGSPECDIEFIKSAVNDDDYLICADRGYSHARAAELEPDLVIGDFDSCEEEIDTGFEVHKLNTDKDFTDTLECVKYAFEEYCTDITILAATGGRLDHTLANLYALDYIAQKGGTGVILSEKERIELLVEGSYLFSGMEGLTFSLFPFGCESATLSVHGAKYGLDEYELKSELPIGVSNVFSSDICRISVKSGKVLIVINTDKDCR